MDQTAKERVQREGEDEASQHFPEALQGSVVPHRGEPDAGPPGGRSPASNVTPVMARLGRAELQVVDTLITVGIAANRAEAIRWALARISERPAYTQLLEQAREIERLKTEF